MFSWLVMAGALAADPLDRLEAHASRALEVDVLLGAPSDLRILQTRMEDVEPASPYAERLLERWRSLVAVPEQGLRVRGVGGLAGGSLRPVLRDGDLEDGWFSARVGPRLRGQVGPIVGELDGDVGLDVLPGASPAWVPRWRVGVQTPGFHLDVGQVPRSFGPASTALLLERDATPPPAASVGGTFRLPGRAASAGRFGVELVAGWLPGEREDVQRPGWLVLDVRWRPAIWLEVGLGRTSLFAGVDEGRSRPVDVGQLILPTQPHIYDDPEQQLPDTDEAAAFDIALRLPLARWVGGPVDLAEVYWQYGGEDVIARSLGPIPYPSLAGVGNLYGLRVQGGPWWGRVEGTILEDDVFRWYRGHRVYHTGWSHRGRSLGHPRGGDMRSLRGTLGAVDPEEGQLEVDVEITRRVRVADRIDRTVFVLREPEHRRELRLRGSRPLGPVGAWLQAEVGLGQVENLDFVPDEDRVLWRVAISVSSRLWTVDRAGAR